MCTSNNFITKSHKISLYVTNQIAMRQASLSSIHSWSSGIVGMMDIFTSASPINIIEQEYDSFLNINSKELHLKNDIIVLWNFPQCHLLVKTIIVFSLLSPCSWLSLHHGYRAKPQDQAIKLVFFLLSKYWEIASVVLLK